MNDARRSALAGEFTALFAGARTAAALVDEEGVVVVANAELAKLLGRDAAELCGGSLADVLPVAAGGSCAAADQALVTDPAASMHTMIEQLADDGSRRWLETARFPLGRSGGLGEHYLLVLYDVTNEKSQAHEISQRAALAQLGELSAAFAHEVKNPIAGIDGALQVIRDRLPESTPEQAVIGEIQLRLRHLDAMVEDMLRFATTAAPVIAPLNLTDLLREIADALTTEGECERVSVDIPEREISVLGDTELLRVLFLNLFINAAQAMGGVGTIRVSTRCDGTSRRVAVADDGPGVPAELRDRIFNPFFTTKSPGTGLGLAIARRAAEAQHGTLTYGQAPSGGAELRVVLPAAPGAPER